MDKKRLTPVARKLRRNRTIVEDRLWQCLRNRQLEGEKFVFQCQIEPYVVDFVCRTAKLVIELDGGQHSVSTTDAGRTELIEAHGYHVIRFWNNDAIDNLDGVREAIRQELLLARGRSE